MMRCDKCGYETANVLVRADGFIICRECIKEEAEYEASQYIPQPEDA